MDRIPNQSQEGNPASSSNSQKRTRFLRNLICPPFRRGDGQSEKDDYLQRYIQERMQEGILTVERLLELRKRNCNDPTGHNIHRDDIVKALSAHIERHVSTLKDPIERNNEALSQAWRQHEQVQRHIRNQVTRNNEEFLQAWYRHLQDQMQHIRDQVERNNEKLLALDNHVRRLEQIVDTRRASTDERNASLRSMIQLAISLDLQGRSGAPAGTNPSGLHIYRTEQGTNVQINTTGGGNYHYE